MGIPSFWFVDPVYSIGALLFAVSLLGLHARYGAEYGLTGRVILALLGLTLVVYAITLTITMPAFGVELTGPAELRPPFGTIGRFILVSVLGVLLYRTSAPRLQAGLLVLVFPVSLIASPFLLDSRVLLALSEVLFAISFALIGWHFPSYPQSGRAGSASV